MINRPETRFAWNGDVALAYQVLGDGPVDLVYLQGYCSNVDMNWESPHLSRFLRGLAALGRLVVMDRRGWGCSDRFSPTDVPPLETLTDDLQVVMDAAGVERATIITSYESTQLVLMFAATHPERCAGLVFIDPWVTFQSTGDMPWMADEARTQEILDELRFEWGTEAWGAAMTDRSERDWYTRYQRASITPGCGLAEYRASLKTDVRAILPSIQVPTLAIVSSGVGGERHLETGRYIGDHLPGARSITIEEPTDQIHWLHWYGRAPSILRETGAFIASIREEQEAFDRVLATVLFTDIVDSTATAAVLGDARWRKLIDEHDRMAKALVARYRGEFVDATGDGILATFDGPARAVRCAQAIVEAGRPLGVEIRAGLHTGEVERAEHGVAGVGVHIGARVGAMAAAGEVWVSSTVKDLTAGAGLSYEDRGERELKGVPDRWRLYRVVGA